MQFKNVVMIASTLFTMGSAHAGLAEITNLVRNSPAMKSYQADNVNYSKVDLHETAVPGMYRATNPNTRTHMFFVHEGLDYIDQINGWSEVKGNKLVLVQGDLAQLELDRKMILEKLPLDSKMAYKFGDGKRALVVIDAFDCGNCRNLDAALKKYGPQYNATVFILPTALNETPETEKIVRNIWCSADPISVWRNFMTTNNYKLKAVDTSSCDPRSTMQTSKDIGRMLRFTGTQTFIQGNINNKAIMSGFPPNSKPEYQKGLLDALIGPGK